MAEIPDVSPTPDFDVVRGSPLEKSLTGLCVEVWKLQKRLKRYESLDMIQESQSRALRDSAERMEEWLTLLAVEAITHDGTADHPGASYEVVHQRDEGEHLTVVETISPSVRIAGRIVRHGQVVVGLIGNKSEGES